MTAIRFSSTTATANFGTGPAAFDPKYYLAKNADVALLLSSVHGTEKDLGALRHFMGHGAAEGRNPSAQFDVKAYLNANPDVARSGVNPLQHFRQHGQAEGRQAFPVQDGLRQSRAVFDLTALPQGAAALGHPGLAFQVDTAGGVAAPSFAPVQGQDVWAHGTALMQPEAQATGARLAFLPPGTGDIQAVIQHGAGIETLLPGLAAKQDAGLLAEVR